MATSDLMGAFKELFVREDSRDIRKILNPPTDMDWKSTPQYKWLTRLSLFFMKLLEVAQNTVLTRKNLKDAMSRLHEEEPVNMTRKHDSDLWDWVDTKIRIGMSQLRDLKNNVHGCLDCAHKKATSEERNKLCELMKRVNLLKVVSETGGSSVGHHTKSTALVVHRPTTSTPSSSSPFLKSKKGNEDMLSSSPRSVFENILKKNVQSLDSTTSSDPWTPNKMKKKKKNKKAKKTRRELSYDEEEESGKEEGGDAVIKILPTGRRIIKERKKEKALDSQPSFFDNLLSVTDGDSSSPEKRQRNRKKKKKERGGPRRQ